jgi:uncharacterized protein
MPAHRQTAQTLARSSDRLHGVHSRTRWARSTTHRALKQCGSSRRLGAGGFCERVRCWYIPCTSRRKELRDGGRNALAGGTVVNALWEETLRGGAHWSGVLRRGVSLRLVARGDNANVAAIFYSREQPLERYNMADTLKAQHTAHLTTGCVCYSDMGRVLCAITADSCGWHDPLCGLTDAKLIEARYGATSFQQQRNARYISGREAMLVELGKYGLDERDLVANINFFSKVSVDGAGGLQLADSHSRSGDSVDLRFEMDSIVVLHAGPHPLATASRYAPPDVLLQAFRTAPLEEGDGCRHRCPENERGYANTERLYLS